MSDRWVDQLSDYLDGELPANERVALEAHLQTCDDCSEVLDQLRQVVAQARTLGGVPPRRDLWAGIAQRIGATPGRKAAGELAFRPRAPRRWSFSIPQLAAAAIALMTLSGGSVWLLRGPASPGPVATMVPQPTGPVPAINTAVRGAVGGTDSYAQAVADLERVLATGRGQLDSTTVRVIEQNLAAIDRAIAQAQAALKADPSNLYLNSHLAETMRRKLDLLRQAAALASVS
ncbi:MAG TPA: zf-HC2 domain-containing protein [Gemmatimonadales bacterium]|nr:zf-HC2 domain-containing protein [Gemmatimonadales bacterium]